MRDSDEALIKARGLVVGGGGGRARLQGVDLEVRREELVTLVGSNGAGKSTLLKAAIGLEPVAAGRLERSPDLRIGYVPQHFAVADNLPLTVERFLNLQLKRPRESLRTVAEEAGIANLLPRPVQGLSGGELRKTLLARALLRSPNLLALDEPAAGLDVNAQTEMYERIDRIRRQRGCGLLVVSHDLHLVMAATDEVVYLQEGRVSCRGTPESVRENPEYRRVFGPHLGPATAVYTHAHPHPHEDCRP